MFGANSLASEKMAEGWRSGEVCAYMSHIVRRGEYLAKTFKNVSRYASF